METRILIPDQLSLIITNTNPSSSNSNSATAKKTALNFAINSLVGVSEECEKPSSSSGFCEADSDSSSVSPSPTSSSSLASPPPKKTFSSDKNNEELNHFHNSSSSPVSPDSDSNSSNFSGEECEVERKDRKKSQKISSSSSFGENKFVKIIANQRVEKGTKLSPTDGQVQIHFLQGIQKLSQNDIRFKFGCFERIVEGLEDGESEKPIRLCNWIRFLKKISSSSNKKNENETNFNLIGRFNRDKSPVFEFTKNVSVGTELRAVFDLSKNETEKEDEEEEEIENEIEEKGGSGNEKEMKNLLIEGPLDLSKSPNLNNTFDNNKKNLFTINNVLEREGGRPTIKLFQPFININSSLSSFSPFQHKPELITPPTTPTISINNTNSNNLSNNSPNLRPILRTRGRERSLLPCNVCGKAFDRPSLLKRHSRVHTGEKPHVCDVCSKGFSTSSSLNTHRRIHTGDKPHICPICGKRFTASSNLYYHRMTHNKEKPHKCQTCNKSFPTPGDLKSHMYVHSGSWPFNCPICHRGFSKQTNLRNHILLHTGNKPHTCQICSKKFALACNLRAHLRTHEEDPVSSCTLCKRTFLASLNMLINGKCRACILNEGSDKFLLTNINDKKSTNPGISTNPTNWINNVQQMHTGIPPHLSHPFLGIFEWNWRLAKEASANSASSPSPATLGMMQQKFIESQMIAAAQLISSNVNNSTNSYPPPPPFTLSDLIRLRSAADFSIENNSNSNNNPNSNFP